jgi:hypothetical protein
MPETYSYNGKMGEVDGDLEDERWKLMVSKGQRLEEGDDGDLISEEQSLDADGSNIIRNNPMRSSLSPSSLPFPQDEKLCRIHGEIMGVSQVISHFSTAATVRRSRGKLFW